MAVNNTLMNHLSLKGGGRIEDRIGNLWTEVGL